MRTRLRPEVAGSKFSISVVWGRGAEAAVEAVAPGVVGALKAAHGALGLGDEARPAVAADVEEPVGAAPVVAHEEQALARDLAGVEGAARGERLRMPDAHPAAEEEVLGLPRGDRLVDVGAGRQLGRLEERPPRRGELLWGEGRGHRGGSVPALRAFDYMVRIA